MKRTIQLTPFQVADAAADLRELPKRKRVLKWGANPTRKGGPVLVNERTLAVFAANQQAMGFDRIALDYEHNTVPGTFEFERSHEPRKVAAFCTPLCVAGEGIFLDSIDYTPSGREFGAEFVDLSPCPMLSDKREVLFMHSVALCRQGAVDGLSLFSMDVPDGAEVADPNEEKELMDKIMALLRKALGLEAAAGEEQIVAGIQAFGALAGRVAAVETAVQPLSALTAAGVQLTTLSSGIETLRGDLSGLKDAKLTDKVTALEQSFQDVQRELICFNARIAGKVIPLSADTLKATDLATLREMVAKIEPTVPLTALSLVIDPARKGVLSEMESEIARNCGVDPAKVLAAKA